MFTLLVQIGFNVHDSLSNKEILRINPCHPGIINDKAVVVFYERSCRLQQNSSITSMNVIKTCRFN